MVCFPVLLVEGSQRVPWAVCIICFSTFWESFSYDWVCSVEPVCIHICMCVGAHLCTGACLDYVRACSCGWRELILGICLPIGCCFSVRFSSPEAHRLSWSCCLALKTPRLFTFGGWNYRRTMVSTQDFHGFWWSELCSCSSHFPVPPP